MLSYEFSNPAFFRGEIVKIRCRHCINRFDIIFNDVEKEDYPKAFRKSVPKLRKGGVLITDNTLWHGKVANEREKDYQTEGAREYNRLAFSDKRVISMIIPLRDGITISLKI